MLLLFYATQAPPAAAGYINLSTSLAELWPALNSTSPIDAIFWDAPEMFQYFDEAVKRMARRFGVFVVYDQSITSAVSTPAYNLPANHISTQQADLAGLTLRPLNIQEAEALDASWPTTVGPPTHFLEDTEGLIQFALYPQADGPNAGKLAGLVMNSFPPDITPAAGILVAPFCLKDYFTFYAIGKAREKETRAQMYESAQFFLGLCDFVEQTIQAVWGSAS